MRLFTAIPLPSVAQHEAARILREFLALDWPVRWVREEGLHLTLKFFGEVAPERLDAIAEMLEFSVAGMQSMSLAIAGAGAFPTPERPRVIRLDLSAGPELELLQDRIERRGMDIGYPPEGRPFHPHVTLGRVKEGQRLPPDAMHLLAQVASGPAFLAEHVVLFESLQEAGGPPRYESRLDLRLGA